MVSYDAGTEQAGVLGSLLHWVTSFAWAHQRKLLSVFFLSVLLEKAKDSAIHPGSISSWEMLGEGDAVTALLRTAGSHPVQVWQKRRVVSFLVTADLSWGIPVRLHLCCHL